MGMYKELFVEINASIEENFDKIWEFTIGDFFYNSADMFKNYESVGARPLSAILEESFVNNVDFFVRKDLGET